MNKKKPDVNVENRGSTMRVGNGKENGVATFLQLSLVVKIISGVIAAMFAVGVVVLTVNDDHHAAIARIDKSMAKLTIASAEVVLSVNMITAACAEMKAAVAVQNERIHGCEKHDAVMDERMKAREAIHEVQH